MLGIQDKLPINSQVKFGSSFIDDDYYNDYNIPEQLPDSVELNEEQINKERDEKIAKVNGVKQDFDNFADTLEKNPNKMFQKAGKFVRVGSMIAGLGVTFIMAKYGSKVSINAFKSFGKSEFVQGILKGGKKLFNKAKPISESVTSGLSNKVSNPIINRLKDSKLGKMASKFLERSAIKNTVDKLVGYKEAGKLLIKSINGEKIQSAMENTMAASATASVLIDDLAGRNDNKSNLDIALGASGGDK